METMRARTKKGDTPLHRAAEKGEIQNIPRHLLAQDLFFEKNYAGQTPLHLAAKYGHLEQVPPEFMTKEAMTITTGGGGYSTRSGYQAKGETPLHVAARCGNAEQVPKEFLKPEFLSIEASGYRMTVLHTLAATNRLDLVPAIYANSEMWNIKDNNGRTARDVLAEKLARDEYVARVRAEPATEKQKEKLRYFGCTFEEDISKGQASDALDKCATDFPEVNKAYYDRPATEEQLAKVREMNQHRDCAEEPFYDFEEEGPLTYGEAKEVMQEWVWFRREKELEEQEKYAKSEEAAIFRAMSDIEDMREGSDVREVTYEEVERAWALAKSRLKDEKRRPGLKAVEAALVELCPELKRQR